MSQHCRPNVCVPCKSVCWHPKCQSEMGVDVRKGPPHPQMGRKVQESETGLKSNISLCRDAWKVEFPSKKGGRNRQ